nr:RNA-binding protein 28-like [Procambarus clarkii]
MAKMQECSLIVTHLPADISRREIQDYFSEVGPVKKCHLVRDKNGTFKGMAYIIYSFVEDAKQAVKKYDNSTFNGKILRVKYSRQRETESDEDVSGAQRNKEEDGEENETNIKKKKTKRKDKRQPAKQRKGRIIIRNLSFKADEKIVEEHFSVYGKIREVSILRKHDGKMVGCAFVQFDTKAEALKAIKECNMKPLLGRPIAVDLAVEKERFKPEGSNSEISRDETGGAEVKIKEEELSNDEKEEIDEENDIKMEIKEESGEEDDIKTEIKEEKASSEDEDGDSGLDDGDETSSDDDDEDDKKHTPSKNTHAPTKGPSKDITEERTLFIKNLPFIATQEEIAEVLQKFGELKYVLLCIDQLTEHPRGTAFVQFKEREAADACLAAEADPSTKKDFILYGRPMHIMRAISRTELEKRRNEKGQEKVKKDKRNLFLAREGFVRQGTKAAEGLSKADLALRTRREQVKRRMLQNFQIFVSETRLCINNLPEKVDDKRLYAIFNKHSPEGAKITEARIMRDFQNIDENGKPKSRGYGFVTFTEHEHALAALRKINNNPDIFTNDQRPIVEFSLENRSVLQARQKRMEKSKEKNPLWKKDGYNARQNATTTDSTKKACQIKKNPEKISEDNEMESQSSFMGSKSNPSNKNLPANYGPKIRHHEKGKGKISRNQFRKERRDRVLGKKRKRPTSEDQGDSSSVKPSQEETEGQGKKKRKRNKKNTSKKMKMETKDERAFNSMVRKYKDKMSSVNSTSDKRWYED